MGAKSKTAGPSEEICIPAAAAWILHPNMSALTDSDYKLLSQLFPSVRFAFSYGSGVIEQSGYDKRVYESSSNERATSGSEGAGGADLPLLDVIFAVDDPRLWHLENKRLNPGHYTSILSSLPDFGPGKLSQRISLRQAGLIAHIQEDYGAHVWFNTHVPMGIPSCPRRLMKYGVVSVQSLVRDLREWDSLYIAGRLHKPVRIFTGINRGEFEASDASVGTIKPADGNLVTLAPQDIDLILRPNEGPGQVQSKGQGQGQMSALMHSNYKFAAATALLVLSSSEQRANDAAGKTATMTTTTTGASFSETDVYLTIASLSYLGDPRMAIAENPKKVNNLVMPVVPQYQALYRRTLLDLARDSGLSSFEDAQGLISFSSHSSEQCRMRLVEELPVNMQAALGRTASKLPPSSATQSSPPSAAAIQRAVASIVRKSATSQSIKGLVTAGVLKAGYYAWQKVKKRFSA